MALVSYDPFNTLSKLQQDVNRAFQSRLSPFDNEDASSVATSSWTPAVDIEEQTDKFVITADVPGVSPDDIEVTMDNGILTIKGERNEEKSVEQKGFRRVERVKGSFYRRFSLPDSANPEGISAHGKNGVLEITIPKGEKAKARRITVNT